MPTFEPIDSLCSAPETLPIFLIQSSKKSLLFGEDGIEKGASPIPKTVSSTNWPGRKQNSFLFYHIINKAITSTSQRPL